MCGCGVGVIGYGAAGFTAIDSPPSLLQVAAGSQHVVMLDVTGRVFTCGTGAYGRLGLGDTRDRETPECVKSLLHIPIQEVAAGHEHTVALSTTKEVFAWGRTGLKALGHSVPLAVPSMAGIGVCHVQAGRGFTACLTTHGSVWTWGPASVKESLGQGFDTSGSTSKPSRIPGLSGHMVPGAPPLAVRPTASYSSPADAAKVSPRLHLHPFSPSHRHFSSVRPPTMSC